RRRGVPGRPPLRGAADRPRGPFVRAVFLAAPDRAAAPRRCAKVLAWRASADLEAARRPSRFKAPRVARERVRDTAFLRRRPAATARLALCRVRSVACPFSGGGKWTPARRAFESPIAIACLVDRAPCLPSRM